ncbi:MAG: DsbA family protein [Chloroflexi bacterium]|nr:DsbA family protein [Chloroflexota bacterium]MCI0574872.1 DsbA family protein [Chloroflexota bacterium]MCI0650098.1 DsbA family protein [Chloroflexota bacterium]MCI0731182.1 DsbA family protein [Chloroflexota bacterium]
MKTRPYLRPLALVFFLLAAVGCGQAPGSAGPEAAVAGDQPGGLEIDANQTETDSKGVPVGFTTDGHAYRGNPDAPVVIEEYSDFQCPFCARFSKETMPALDANQVANGQAVVVYYDFPLTSIHPQASVAANAARCAGEQSAASYWAMHDLLFANPAEWSSPNANGVFSRYGERIGLEMEAFNACLQNNKYRDQVQADLNAGVERGINSTPSFFINGQLFVGAQPVAAFDQAIVAVQSGQELASAANTATQPQQPTQAGPPPTPASFSGDFAAAMGDPDAPITIIEFTDYQCPYCQRHSTQTMPQIISEMVENGRVYYILKDFPLDQIHRDARAGAVAARCAGEQDAYWGMHDLLFSRQNEWAGQGVGATPVFVNFAASLGLDADDFSTCLASGRYDDAVQANLVEGQSLGVGGTPAFFIDGYQLSGARPYEHFEIAVGLAEEGRLAEALAPQQQPAQPQQPAGPVDVPIGDAYVLGDPDAPVTIVEYTDYQCPYCVRHFNETYPQIMTEYVEQGLVRYVFKDFPLTSIHPQAAKAAEAARCARDQEAFLEMHDMLFARQQEWGGKGNAPEIFIGFAETLELDVEVFSQCLNSNKHQAGVTADLQEGINLGITGTPGFFLNGNLVSGALPFGQFQQAIDQLLSEPQS